MEIQKLVDVIKSKNSSIVIPWTTAVPGATTNWTSEAETRRRRSPDTLKTGKKNTRQVAAYVRYNNMSDMWSCIAPMNSQNTSQYTEGDQFPACELFQHGNYGI